ncbi:class D beta-lactamase [Legionella lytica]|uniref:Beta-lactamase n=1 Tax=Legionella lytica TaxID=96232 RepID=A0ABW8D560_9GAMM
MHKLALFFSVLLGVTTQGWANDDCFIAKENGKVVQQEGACSLRQAPCSTFKIAISLMGFNEGILMDALHPEWPFNEGYSDYLEVWKQPHNPTTWMKNSCVWYSQLITQKLGMERFKQYVQAFHYGNEDVSGDKGENNGLTRAWLSSSLRISPQQQMDFLTRLEQGKLPVSTHAMTMTKKILFAEELPGNWKLFGKTGAGYFFNEDGLKLLDKQIGWFVGWAQKEQRTIYFVQFVVEKDNKEFTTGKHARELVKQKITRLMRLG